MNKIYASVAALFLSAQLSSPLRADADQPDPVLEHKKMTEHRAEEQQKALENMTKKLNLTEDQQKAVKLLMSQQGEKMQAVTKESMEKRKAIHDATDAEIVKLLKDDQKKQFEQWKTERKEHFKERMNRHGHEMGTPSEQ